MLILNASCKKVILKIIICLDIILDISDVIQSSIEVRSSEVGIMGIIVILIGTFIGNIDNI